MLGALACAALAFSAPPLARPSRSPTAVRTAPLAPPLAQPLPPRAAAPSRCAARMDESPDNLIEYSLRMLGFGASAVAGLVFTIFIGPIQAFMRNPKTGAIAGVVLAALAVGLGVTLSAMLGADTSDMPREAVQQADSFNDFVPPRIE